MKFKTSHSFIIYLILILAYSEFIQAVTDAELEALEKQIEQQEAESRKKIEEKRKAEQEQQRQTEIQAKEKRKKEKERQRQTELADQNKEKEKKKELERKIKEEEKLLAEKERETIYNKHIDLADIYMAKDEFENAISEFQIVLDSFPGDVRAEEGINKAKEYLSACNDIVGKWLVAPNGITWVIYDDNTVFGSWLIFSANGFWECVDARKREVVITWPECAVCFTEYFYISDDANTLHPSRGAVSLGKRVDESSIDIKKQPDVKL